MAWTSDPASWGGNSWYIDLLMAAPGLFQE